VSIGSASHSAPSNVVRRATGYSTLELSPPTLDDEKPFAVGRVSNTYGWVHVFEEMTLPVVMAELSTIADFLD
jgi:hypothetical protein